ncbi:berberine bridge enzyme-like 8 isoform X3 [Ziziphus jujuba]|uniref:Berberine bridge enzyme-like 8 isoform X3 n=1 Tax=Ziziphus jujuba TaxID=326968 RepID=A0ABM4A3F6_ZIZJJ|nr:berberine bridge enzyme-like 8 isoform X3 [Ziziphus jujuba]
MSKSDYESCRDGLCYSWKYYKCCEKGVTSSVGISALPHLRARERVFDGSVRTHNIDMKIKKPPTRRASRSSTTIFSLCSVLLISLSLEASSSSIQDNFVQCLTNHSYASHPISEVIYLPNNASFKSVLQSKVRNLRFMTPSTPKPLVIVAAKNESHVQHTVLCAKSVGLEIRIRSGGHDFEGVSYVSRKPFIVLDMFNLRSIDIDIASETAWVQSGATLGEIYYGIANKSKYHAFPGGVCPTLGAGGHFTGGGYGNLMRKFGLSVDNIIDAKIVDAKGTILDRESMGEDLFWVIRGGGASSFGVILSWKIKLVKIPSTVTVFRVERTLEQGATDIVLQWQKVADKLHEDLFVRLVIQLVNASKEGDEKTIKASFIALFLGQSKSLLNLIKQSFPKLGLQRKDCIEMSWVESILYWADFPNGTAPEVLLIENSTEIIFFKLKSDYVKEIIPRDGLEAIWKKMIESGGVRMQWNPYGGKMSEISESETPFPHRKGNVFKIQYSVGWREDGSETTTNRYLDLIKEFHEAMTPFVSKDPREAFLNYRDLDIGTSSTGKYKEGRVYGTKYFKGNFDRLVKVKTMVDPDNFFRNEQSIPTSP